MITKNEKVWVWETSTGTEHTYTYNTLNVILHNTRFRINRFDDINLQRKIEYWERLFECALRHYLKTEDKEPILFIHTAINWVTAKRNERWDMLRERVREIV